MTYPILRAFAFAAVFALAPARAQDDSTKGAATAPSAERLATYRAETDAFRYVLSLGQSPLPAR